MEEAFLQNSQILDSIWLWVYILFHNLGICAGVIAICYAFNFFGNLQIDKFGA